MKKILLLIVAFALVLCCSEDIRNETEIPLIVMTYTNIIYRYGYDQFIFNAKKLLFCPPFDAFYLLVEKGYFSRK